MNKPPLNKLLDEVIRQLVFSVIDKDKLCELLYEQVKSCFRAPDIAMRIPMDNLKITYEVVDENL